MKAAVYYENGGPESPALRGCAGPGLSGPGLRADHRQEAVSIEGGDTLNRFRGALADKPHIVGYQAAGEIIEIGAGGRASARRAEGRDRQYVRFPCRAARRVPARTAWPIPDSFNPEQGRGHPGRRWHGR